MVTTVSINAGGAPFVEIQDSGGAATGLTATNVDNTLAIGGDLTVADGINMLSIGANNQLDGQGNDQGDINKVVQIGFDNTYNEIFGFGGLGDNIQIGFDNTHTSSATENIQIGNDITTNASTRSVVIGHTITLNNNCPDAILIGQAPAVSPNSSFPIAIGPTATISNGSDNCISLGSVATCTSNNAIAFGVSATAEGQSTIVIGDSASTDDTTAGTNECVVIGARADVSPTTLTNGAVVIGVDAAAANGVGQIAIGNTAVTGAASAIQLGTGTNNTASTVQYLTQPIANNFGIQAKTVAVTPTDAANDGTIQVDNVADALYFRSGGAWIEAGGSGSFQWPDTSLVSYWTLDEASGTRVDSESAGNDLTDNNTVTSQAGLIGNEAVFVLANSEFLDSSTFSLGASTNFFLSAWVTLDAKGNDQHIISQDTISGSSRGFQLEFNNGSDRFRFRFSNDGSATSVFSFDGLGSPSTGVRYHLCVSVDTSGNERFYVDGVLDSTHSGLAGGVFQSTADLRLGSSDNTVTFDEFFDGKLDEVGIWSGADIGNSSLSIDELVLILYNNGAGLARTATSGPNLFSTVKVQATGVDPTTTPATGTLVFDTSTNVLYAYNGSAWVQSAAFT